MSSLRATGTSQRPIREFVYLDLVERPNLREIDSNGFADTRLHSKAPVRSAMVVGDVLADYAFGMATVTDDHMIEAAASNGSDHPLSEGIRLGRSGGRHYWTGHIPPIIGAQMPE